MTLWQDGPLSHNYTQLVEGPTHVAGHTLDLIVVNENNSSLMVPRRIQRVDPSISDHFIIECTLNLHKTHEVRTTYVSRNYRAIEHAAFDKDLDTKFKDILSLNHADGNTLVKRYNEACTEVLEAHAPQSVRTRTIRRKPLWFNDTVEEARRVRRRRERKFRKTKSEADQIAYFDAQKNVSTIIDNAKCEYYQNKLANTSNSNAKETVNELLHKNISKLPDSKSPTKLAKQFSEFFTHKVDKIHNAVSNIQSSTNQTNVADVTKCSTCMSSFVQISEEELTNVIKKCPTKSCDLFPHGFLRNTCLLSSLL